MNILYLYDSDFLPEKGGTERITSIIINGLEAIGHKCYAFLVIDPHTHQISYQGEKIDNLLSFLSENHIDIVVNQIAYSTWLLDTFLLQGGQQWHNKGKKIISCLHFDPQNPNRYYYYKCIEKKTYKDWINLLRYRLLRRYYEYKDDIYFGEIYKQIYNKSDYFILLSKNHIPYLKRVMKVQSLNKAKVINNPLTFKDISPIQILSHKKNVCIVVARMSEYHKRISLILKIWEILNKERPQHGWILKIIGEGESLPRYKRYVDKHKIQNIEFLGQQSPDHFYTEAKIFLMTSVNEGWGLTLTESLQRGVVPIVMDSSPVFKEIVTNEYCGFITPNNNITIFKSKLEELIQDNILWERMAKNALEQAKKFNIKETISKWEEIINS